MLVVCTGHIVVASNISVVTSDRLETLLDTVCVYFIRPEDLPALQQEFNLR